MTIQTSYIYLQCTESMLLFSMCTVFKTLITKTGFCGVDIFHWFWLNRRWRIARDRICCVQSLQIPYTTNTDKDHVVLENFRWSITTHKYKGQFRISIHHARLYNRHRWSYPQVISMRWSFSTWGSAMLGVQKWNLWSLLLKNQQTELK